MEIAVLSPRNQFVLHYENQSRGRFAVNNTEVQIRDIEAANASFNGDIFKYKMSHNQHPPVSYRILPPPNNLRFPPVNNLQFINDSTSRFPQICSVNGVQASPVPGTENWPSWPFCSPSQECEIHKNAVAFGLSQHPLFPYHSFSSPCPTSSSLHPHISFSSGSQPMHLGRRCHSMPEEGFSSNQNNILKGGKGAPLFRNQSASIPLAKVAENAADDSKKTRPWKDKRSPKPNFEWKLVNSGLQNPEKQTPMASQNINNQKKIAVKEETDSEKNCERRNKNTRGVPPSKGKGIITLLKRLPKSEIQFGVNNLTQAVGESTITDTTDVDHVQKNEEETDMGVLSSGYHQALSGSPSKSAGSSISNLPQKESSNFDVGMDHYRRHKKSCDNGFGLLCECDTDERIVFKPDIQCYEEDKAWQNFASLTPDFNSKDSCENSQIGHSFSRVDSESSLVLEGELFVGGNTSCGTDDTAKVEILAVSGSLCPTENWAGPAYTNSPSPGSLPVPRFSMREMRSTSLDLSPAKNEFNEGGLPSSHSAPPSPTRDAQQSTTLLPTGQMLQGRALSLDADFATKDLRRILNIS